MYDTSYRIPADPMAGAVVGYCSIVARRTGEDISLVSRQPHVDRPSAVKRNALHVVRWFVIHDQWSSPAVCQILCLCIPNNKVFHTLHRRYVSPHRGVLLVTQTPAPGEISRNRPGTDWVLVCASSIAQSFASSTLIGTGASEASPCTNGSIEISLRHLRHVFLHDRYRSLGIPGTVLPPVLHHFCAQRRHQRRRQARSVFGRAVVISSAT